MGRDRLVDIYLERHSEDVKAEVWALADYTRCRQSANNERAKRLGRDARRRIEELRATLDESVNSRFYLAALHLAGGGKAYERENVAALAEMEDLIGAVVPLLAQPSRAPRPTRSKADETLALLDEKLAALARPKDLGEEYRAEYDKVYADLRAAIERLERIIKSLPDEAAFRVAKGALNMLAFSPGAASGRS